MKYLFIDSATANLVVAIIVDNKVKHLFNETVGKEMSVIIMPKIKEAFDKCNLKPNEIDKIFVTTGPGSFTGIRVGLTVAKTMAYTLNVPIIPLSSLEVIASGSNENTIALIDARRGYVFAGGYDKDLNNFYEDKYVLLNEIDKNILLASYDNIPKTIKPNVNVLKIVNKHQNDKGVNPHKVNPNYLKLTEAEEKLNDRTNNG